MIVKIRLPMKIRLSLNPHYVSKVTLPVRDRGGQEKEATPMVSFGRYIILHQLKLLADISGKDEAHTANKLNSLTDKAK